MTHHCLIHPARYFEDGASCPDCAALPPVRSEPLLAEAVSIIQRLQNDLLECLQSYAMTEAAQVEIMGLLKEATLFRRKANAGGEGRP